MDESHATRRRDGRGRGAGGGGSPEGDRSLRPTMASRAADPDPEVSAKGQRQHFPAEYRLRILTEADACKKPGEVGALLRREDLYSSLLTNWRRQRGRAPCGRCAGAAGDRRRARSTRA